MQQQPIKEICTSWAVYSSRWFGIWLGLSFITAIMGGCIGLAQKSGEAKKYRDAQTDYITHYHAPYQYFSEREERQDIRRALQKYHNKHSRITEEDIRAAGFKWMTTCFFGCLSIATLALPIFCGGALLHFIYERLRR